MRGLVFGWPFFEVQEDEDGLRGNRLRLTGCIKLMWFVIRYFDVEKVGEPMGFEEVQHRGLGGLTSIRFTRISKTEKTFCVVPILGIYNIMLVHCLQAIIIPHKSITCHF